MRMHYLTFILVALLIGSCQSASRPAGTSTAGPQAIEAPRPESTDGANTAALATAPADEGMAAGPSSESPAGSEPEAAASATFFAGAEAQASAALTETQATPDPTIVALAARFQFPRRGRADAPVQIYEFSDYLCPYCRKLALETEPKVIKDYVNTGKVAITFVDFPLIQLHGYAALLSHEAAHCAGEEGKYWSMHDIIFEQGDQLTALAAADEAAIRAVLVSFARPAGVNADRLRLCLESGKYRPIIGSIMQDAADHGVEMTPTLLVGDQTVPGYLPYDQLKAVIDEQLAKSQQ